MTRRLLAAGLIRLDRVIGTHRRRRMDRDLARCPHGNTALVSLWFSEPDCPEQAVGVGLCAQCIADGEVGHWRLPFPDQFTQRSVDRFARRYAWTRDRVAHTAYRRERRIPLRSRTAVAR